jgi:hypothetical protein
MVSCLGSKILECGWLAQTKKAPTWSRRLMVTSDSQKVRCGNWLRRAFQDSADGIPPQARTDPQG